MAIADTKAEQKPKDGFSQTMQGVGKIANNAAASSMGKSSNKTPQGQASPSGNQQVDKFNPISNQSKSRNVGNKVNANLDQKAKAATGAVPNKAANPLNALKQKLPGGLGKAGKIAGTLGKIGRGGDAKKQMQDMMKKLTDQIKKFAKLAIKKAAEAAGNAIAPGLGKLAAIGADILMDKKKRERLLWLLLGVSVGSFFLIASIIQMMGGAGGTQEEGSQVNPLTISKSGPDKVPNSQNFLYTIQVGYPYAAQDLIVTDTLDKNTELISSSWTKYSYDKTSNTITWKMSDNDPSALKSTGINESFTFTVKPLIQNNYVFNLGATAQVIGSSGATNTAYVPPSTNNCQGKYAADIAKNKLLAENFGDPQCNYSHDQLYSQLLQQENNNKQLADIWLTIVLPGEFGGGSVFNPDSFGPPVLDPGGSWGMFQMGSTSRKVNNVETDTLPLPPPAPGENGEYDRGDVNWQVQVSNAVNYNHTVLHCSFWYWRGYRIWYIKNHPGTSCTQNDESCPAAAQC